MVSRIREIRESQGMSQFGLAIASKTPQSLLCALELGKMQPWPAVVKRISKALKVPPESLFTEEEPCATKR